MFKDLFQKKKKYISVQAASTSQIPEGIMNKCKHCSKALYKKDLEKNLMVCPHCQFHHSIGALERLYTIVDENSFQAFDEDMTSKDPLGFEHYLEKLESDKKKTGLNEAVLTGEAMLHSIPFVIGIMDSGFRMGSMGSVVGEKITRAIEKSIEKKLPFVLFSASGGARMQEGVLSLMQMAKTSAALKRLDEKGLLFISVMTNPTTGGVSASFSSLGDLNIAEPGATIGFAGRRIIEQTIRQELPDGFQTSEFLLDHGQLDAIVHRKDMKDFLHNILTLHQ